MCNCNLIIHFSHLTLSETLLPRILILMININDQLRVECVLKRKIFTSILSFLFINNDKLQIVKY